MRRRFVVALFIGLLIVAAITGVVLAQGLGGGIDLSSLPGSGWWVSWQVQNVGTADAQLSVVALWAQGEGDTTEFSKSLTVPAGQSVLFIPGQINPLGLPDEFIGSAVLSADQPIVAVGNVANNVLFNGALGVEGGKAAAMYQGISGDDADTKISFPVMKNDFLGHTTTYYVQAAGQAAEVTITYKTNDGNTYPDGPYTLQANQMHIFTPSDAGVPSGCPGPANTATCVGSAIVESSTGPIVGVYTEHETAASPAVWVMSTKGFTPSDADTMVAAPIFKYDFPASNPRTTGLTVQNAEADATVTVNVEFRGAKGACADQTYTGTPATLGPGESVIYYPKGAIRNVGDMPANCLASAIITANGGKVVAVVNEAGSNKFTVYGAFPVSRATRKVALPIVKELFPTNDPRTTGVVIMNVGDTATNVTATYNVVKKQGGVNPGSVVVGPFSIPPGGSEVLWKISDRSGVWGTAKTELLNTNNGVLIESDSENIVVIAQEADLAGTYDIKNYEGFNLQP